MATWAEINEQIAAAGPNGQDTVRRAKLAELQSITGRPVILYAVEMFNRRKIDAAGGEITIDLTDKEGFKEALKEIEGDNLDVILHSPGGSPEAGLKLQRNTAQPAYHGEDCPYDHVLYVVSGKFHVRMPGGDEIEFGPGEVGVIPAGHDLRVTSSEPAVWLEIKR